MMLTPYCKLYHKEEEKAGDCSPLITVNSDSSNLCKKYVNINRFKLHEQKEMVFFRSKEYTVQPLMSFSTIVALLRISLIYTW